MLPRGRKGLTVRSSVCSINMRRFVALIRALSVTAMPRTLPKPMPFTGGTATRLMTVTKAWGKRIKRVSGISLPKRQRNTEPMSVKCGTGCMGKSPQGAGNMTGNTKTGIWSDKEVQKGWLQSTS